MTRIDALDRLRPHEQELRAAGLAGLYLFGSTARDEAGPESDVDLAYELDPAHQIDLFDLFAIRERIGDALGARIDLVQRDFMRPRIRAHAETDMAKVF